MNQHSIAERWRPKQQALAAQVASCLTHGTPTEINLSIPRHTATAPVLRQFAYDPAHRGRSIPIVFADSSRPIPFPAGCLSAGPTAPSDGPVLKLGLCSFRHPDMDYLVDLYLMRNRDLGDEPSMAAEEEQTCRRTVEMFADPAIRGGCQIHVLHTGLEPMVVGFYRGITTVLHERQRRNLPRTLVVIPHFYAHDESAKTAISPDSPGAKPEFYTPSTPWW